MRLMGRSGLLAALLTTTALSVAPAQAGAVSFFRGDIAVGTNPTSVVVANFNGGAPDLAVASEGSDSVSILLGNGLGQFTATTPVSTGDLPSSVVAGDFDGDPFTDLAIASVGADNIAIRLGDGTGSFSGTGTVATGTDPRAIAVGDFNNDNKTDLISANTASSTVSILLGDAMGGFAADGTPFDTTTNTAANPVSIAVGRFENPPPPGTPDPDLDAIITSQTNDQLLTLFGDGTGEITGSGTNYVPAFSAMNPDPSAVAVGSLNPSSPNPGFAAEPDILVANQVPDNLFPAFGRTDGTAFDFGGALPTGADPVAVAFGDLDGDGDPDGISANSGGSSATVILSDGLGGTSVDTSSPVGSSPRAVATGGFDADARADAALANYDSNSVTVLTSLQPGPMATPPATQPAAPRKCKKKKKKRNKTASASKKCKRKKR
jgi:hypothetical protein